MPRIHVVIATYGAIYPHKFHFDQDKKERFLRYNVAILNQWNSESISRITIMRPSIDPTHMAITDYYNFEGMDISNIRDKIHILECPNQGISYGQFLRALFATKDDAFDYHIFLEDDYTLAHERADMLLVEEYEQKKNGGLYLTLGICKSAYVDKAQRKYQYYLRHVQMDDGSVVQTPIPDFSIGMIDNHSVQRILERYGTIERALADLGDHAMLSCQITFGYMLCKCGIEVQDADEYLAVFWDNARRVVQFVNLVTDYNDIKQRPFDPSEKAYKCPLAIPLDILFSANMVDDIIKMYITEEEPFDQAIHMARATIGLN